MQPTPAAENTAQAMRHIDGLRPHPAQPRSTIEPNDPKIQELARDIKKNGVIEPLIITHDGLILAGTRRRAAARIARVFEVPVCFRELDPATHPAEVMLSENMQRQSLSLLEEARGFDAVKQHHGFTNADLARYLRITPPNVNNRLAILRCTEEVQEMYHRDLLPLGAAPFLAAITSAGKQNQFAGMLERHHLTLEDLKDRVRHDKKLTRDKGEAAAKPTAKAAGKARAARATRPSHHRPVENTVVITRDSARMALTEKSSLKIPLHTIAVVFDQTCCACGMSDQKDVCMKCPLPRLINAIAGRAS